MATKKQQVLIDEAKERLLALLEKSTPKGEVKCRVDTVSRSGMSRTINFWLIVDGDLISIDHYIALIGGYTRSKSGAIKVSGCGMDMGWHVISNLCYSLYWNRDQTKKEQHEAAYKLRVRWI